MRQIGHLILVIQSIIWNSSFNDKIFYFNQTFFLTGGSPHLPQGLPQQYYSGYKGCIDGVQVDNRDLSLVAHGDSSKIKFCDTWDKVIVLLYNLGNQFHLLIFIFSSLFYLHSYENILWVMKLNKLMEGFNPQIPLQPNLLSVGNEILLLYHSRSSDRAIWKLL